jgi:hypothetical protein
MRRAARTDGNHDVIRDALRKAGCFVHDLSAHGNGTPDLYVARAGSSWWLEVKNGSLSPSRRKLTPEQVEFRAALGKHGIPVYVVSSVSEAFEAVGVQK